MDNRAYFDRGLAKCGLKKYEDTIIDFNKVIELEPKEIFGYLCKTSCYIEITAKKLLNLILRRKY